MIAGTDSCWHGVADASGFGREKKMNQLMLAANAICKRYGAVTVLENVSLEVRAGEVHALVGANGAGKSTLCKILSALTPATSGTITLAGQPFAPPNKQAAELAGVQIVQQELNLIPSLSVAENVLFTRLPTRWGVIDRKQLHQRARVALNRLGLADIDTHAIVQSLGIGRQQMVEIAAALDQQCRVLILDEPTAALSGRETERLFDQLRRLRREGVAIIYISHRLDEVSRLADRVTILRDGKRVCTQEVGSLTAEHMVDLMSGEEAAAHHHEFQSFTTDRIALRVVEMESPAVHQVSLTVHQGERLGIAGLVGSGRTELLRLIFGADRATGGTIELNQAARPGRFSHPHQAVRAGLAMVTEDRKQNGLLLPDSIRANTSLCSLGEKFARFGLLRGAAERRAAIEMIDSLETRCTGIEQTVDTLSGGNQQKVAVSKWLVRDADVFFFDEPTRGIDVSARRRIYHLFHSLAQAGKALVIVSSDLDELLETCDRIAVMSAGRMVAEFSRADFSGDRIMQAAFSGYLTAEVA
jgi:ribose transport system ATP-binding protein